MEKGLKGFYYNFQPEKILRLSDKIFLYNFYFLSNLRFLCGKVINDGLKIFFIFLSTCIELIMKCKFSQNISF